MTAAIHNTIEEIANICEAEWLNKNEAAPPFSYISLDSRKVSFPEATIFFSINNGQHIANTFFKNLYDRGVRNFVTDDKNFSIQQYDSANILFVKNTVAALQKLAAFHRKKFRHPDFRLIAITGSNGKTIVKEWLNQLLQHDFSIVRSPKSYNSQIGVPLSVLHIEAGNNLGIFEAGISKPGEMEKLEKILSPDIGIFTNIGNAHDEGFKNRQQKIQEKLLLFKNAKYLIYDVGDKSLSTQIEIFQKLHPHLKLFSWGNIDGVSLKLLGSNKIKNSTVINLQYDKKELSFEIPFTDEASFQNAIHCLCVLILLKVPLKPEIFRKLYPIEMRLELKEGVHNCHIINDSYSNDLYSLGIALDFLNQQKQHPKKALILSDILQSGKRPEQLYKEVANLIEQKNINRFIGIGKDISSQKQFFNKIENAVFYSFAEDFLRDVNQMGFNDETILIKGARNFRFERISHVLEKKVHQTVLSINLSAIVHNLKKYREKLRPETKIMVMVKAFGYGSGSYEIASTLEYNKVDYLAVAYADEGVELRKAGISLPIMVMNIDSNAFDSILAWQLEPELFSFRILNEFLEYLKKQEIDNYPVHLKIDTGMHRLGFMGDEISSLCEIISQSSYIRIKSVFSHLAASEDPSEDSFTNSQYQTFQKACVELEKSLHYSFIKHIDNTAGISRHADLQMDMVRLGIGLYGIDSNPEMQKELRNVSTLTTRISQIKKLKPGETVGYGRMGKIDKPSIIATVPIGYADGYFRNLGNGKGKMLFHDHLVPVIGNVCMDMTMLDISMVKNINEIDEITIFGKELPIQTLAFWAETIPYEILTAISQRVKRVYYEE